MSGYEYTGRDLPRGEGMAVLLDDHVARQDYLRSFREMIWAFSYLYLNGQRNFDIMDPTSGRVRGFFLDQDENVEFQSQRLLKALDGIQGHLAALDVTHAVASTDESLAGNRERAIADIMLKSSTSPMQIRETGRLFRLFLTTLGLVGLTGHVRDFPTIGLTADLEVIHPAELMPFPAVGHNLARQCGLIRRRYLSLKAIERLFPNTALDKDKIRWWSKRIGDPMPEPVGADGAPLSTGTNDGIRYIGEGPTGALTDAQTEGVAQIVELWLDGPRGTCARYVVASGKQILHDETFDQSPVWCPIGVARCIETGSFWGAGFFDLLFSIHRQGESLKKALFNNVTDLDRYGFLVIPNGAINEKKAFEEVGRRLRILTYEPDALAGSDFRPFSVTPHTTGDFPGKVAAMADEEMDSINPHRDLVREKGRIDSASGLSYLEEHIQQAFTTSTDATNNCYGTVYRSVASRLASSLLTSPRPLPVGRLTLDLAGAVIDPETMSVNFPRNPLPDISRLTFGIKALAPRSQSVRVQQALEALQVGLSTPMQTILFFLENGLDYAIWMRKWRAPYETVVRNILMMFNDGQTPGVIVAHPHTNAPNLQLEVLDAFMSSPIMSLASGQVTANFIRYRQDLLTDAGRGVLPSSTPAPEALSFEAALKGLQTQQQTG